MPLKELKKIVEEAGLVVGFSKEKKLRIDVMKSIKSPGSRVSNAHELDSFLKKAAEETKTRITGTEGDHTDFENII